jgi:hypothetical protein
MYDFGLRTLSAWLLMTVTAHAYEEIRVTVVDSDNAAFKVASFIDVETEPKLKPVWTGEDGEVTIRIESCESVVSVRALPRDDNYQNSIRYVCTSNIPIEIEVWLIGSRTRTAPFKDGLPNPTGNVRATTEPFQRVWPKASRALNNVVDFP